MSTELKGSAIAAEVMADLEDVVRQSEQGIVSDPELVKRITERSRRVQEVLRQKYGQLNVAVDLIREIRDEQ